MHAKYRNDWYKTLTFTQRNEFYQADTLAGQSIWYEALEYPDKLRIDLGDINLGNAVIFRNDSIYSFKGGELKKAAPRKNTLTFLLGGMFFYSFDDVLEKLQEEGYNVEKGYPTTFKGDKVWVVGAENEGEKVNQIYINMDHLYINRVIFFKEGKKVDGHFEDHQQFGDTWCETRVTFYVDDILYQAEYYEDIEVNPELPINTFDPHSFGGAHWYTSN